MQTDKPLTLAASAAILLLISGCSAQKAETGTPTAAKTIPAAPAAAKNDSAALQGIWKGKEIDGQAEGDCYIIIKGNELEYRGADPAEWYKGTFTLREEANPKRLIGEVLDCPAPKYIGKKCQAIYRFQGGKLNITGNEPGNPDVPFAFDAQGSRQFVLEKE